MSVWCVCMCVRMLGKGRRKIKERRLSSKSGWCRVDGKCKEREVTDIESQSEWKPNSQ